MYKIHFKDGKEASISSDGNGNWNLDGHTISPDIRSIGNNKRHILLGTRSLITEVLSFDRESKEFRIRVGSKEVTFTVSDKYDQLLHELGMDDVMSKKADDMKAPMPGLVVDVNVNPGDEVKKGDKILVLEAMKMENILKAAADGIVKKVHVEKQHKVEKNQVLVEFQ
jgi:acetyl/propionyl-CoA carboxylase alpha subunit